jgi:uncharacterized delta-60 repeat protein
MRYLSNGALDDSFGTDGIVTTDIGVGKSIVLQPDGKIVVAELTGSGVDGDSDFAVARYLSNGTLDNSFSTDGIVIKDFAAKSDIPHGVALQPDGKIVVIGSTINGTNKEDFALVRYDPDGILDFYTVTAIGTNSDFANSVALQPDGKIVVAGGAKIGTTYEFAIVRYKPSFSGDGKQITAIGTSQSIASAMAMQSDGKIVVVGNTSGTIGQDIAVVRYKADGSLDNSFGTGGITITDFDNFSNDSPTAVCVQPDGKIVVTGYSYNFSIQSLIIVRYNPDGTLDNGFGTNGKMAAGIGMINICYANAGALQSDEKIVVAGSAQNGANLGDVFVARCLAGPSVGVIDANATFSSPLIYPNPVSNGTLTLGYTLPAASPVHIELMDSEGKSICTLINGARALGENQESLQLPEGLPDGFYLVNIQTKLGNSVVRINKLNR